MKNLKSLKENQIEPIEKMSCIRGGYCEVTSGGSIVIGTRLFSYSCDAITDGINTNYFSYSADTASGFEACKKESIDG
jgi:hypothetical protein